MESASFPEAPMNSCMKSQVRFPQAHSVTTVLSYANGPKQDMFIRGRTENFHASFLLKTPPLVASEEIFKIASMAPGALLLEAQKEYEVISRQLLRFPACSLPFSLLD